MNSPIRTGVEGQKTTTKSVDQSTFRSSITLCLKNNNDKEKFLKGVCD